MIVNRIKSALALLLLLGISLPALAGHPYKREVIRDTVCHASVEVMQQVIDDFYRQFQSCPDSLFLWAYEGLQETEKEKKGPKTKESRNAIQLKYKNRQYNPATKIGDVAIDIYVIGMPWWKDQHLETEYQLYPMTDDAPYPMVAHLKANYSGSILRGAHFMMHYMPVSETETYLYYEFSIGFGNLLTAFISDKTWCNAIEWRFVTIYNNLVQAAELGGMQPMIDHVIAMRSLKN